jgi:hypothetical protein
MTKKKWKVYGVIAAFVVLASFAVPSFADEVSDLQARLDAAEARIAELQPVNDIDVQRSREMRSLVQEVLADAESRASFQGAKSPVTINVHGFVQSRYSYNSGGDVEANHGFEIPRARLVFTGKVYDFDYRVSGQWSDGNNFDLLDAWGEGNLFGMKIKFGQFKSPFMKSWDVYAADTLAADRSLVTFTYGQGRSQGVQLSKDFGSLRVRAAYTDGFNSANGAGVPNGYALSGRVEWDVTDWWSLGGAISWNDLDVTDYWTWTVDTGLKFGGFGLEAAYVGRNQDSGNDWAMQVQGSYFITDEFQPYAQYEYGKLPGEDDLSLVTVGFNWYFNTNVKWTTDFGYSFNGIGAGWDTATTGWNASADSGEYLVRTQVQLQF